MKTTSILIRTSMLAAPLAMAAGMASAGGMAEPVIAPAPAPAPVMAPAPVRMGSDWTSFYAGGQVGYGQLDSDAVADDTNGLTYGAHAGYLYDLGTIVLGAELDVDGTQIEDDAADIALDSVARAKLRVGYDAGVWMPYLTAGVARATTSGTLDDTDDGSFGGIGLDYQASNNIRVGGEVLQHQFEDFGGAADIDATTASTRVSFSF